jgi:hypothetical protein
VADLVLMKATSFDQLLSADQRAKITDRTLAIWREIYGYVRRHRQTDVFDPPLQKELSDTLGTWLSDSTLRRHVKRMTDAGLLEAHRIVIRYSPLGRAFLGAGFGYRGEGPPPGTFLRYTLPGDEPTLESSDSNTKRFNLRCSERRTVRMPGVVS